MEKLFRILISSYPEAEQGVLLWLWSKWWGQVVLAIWIVFALELFWQALH